LIAKEWFFGDVTVKDLRHCIITVL